MTVNDAGLTEIEISATEKLLDRALSWHPLPYYEPEERVALAIFVASLRASQRARGRKPKRRVQHRKQRVNIFLRHVIDPQFRRDTKAVRSERTAMEILDWLDGTGIKATITQVRRDIADALKSGPVQYP